MFELTLGNILFVACIVVFTAVASVWDLRTRRIPNAVTVTGFVVGLLYQVSFHGLAGLREAALGFCVGFGFFFLLWMLGSGGGGDVKLMAAVGVFLGPKLTVMVIVASTLFVLVGSLAVIAWSFLTRGVFGTKRKYHRETKDGKKSKVPVEAAAAERQKRRIMAFALPVALATWLVVLLNAAAVVSGPLSR